jgi:hypothetical protein
MRGIRLFSVTLLFITFYISYANNVLRIVDKVKYNSENNCDASDKLLFQQKAMLCGSLVQAHTWWCGDLWKNVTSKPSCDWPSQVVYFQEILNTLIAPHTCLNTSFAKDTINWLNVGMASQDIGGNWMNTWMVFQVQYYDMPRKPGSRIESPDTLGRKCWAFSYIKQFWNPDPLKKAVASVGMNISALAAATENAIPFTMNLCKKVMANCFINSTYTPSRKGSCPGKIALFHYLGFDRENLKRHNILKYPF